MFRPLFFLDIKEMTLIHDIFNLFQVRSNYRTSITIPERSWGRFRDMLSEFADRGHDGGQ